MKRLEQTIAKLNNEIGYLKKNSGDKNEEIEILKK